MKLPSQRLCLVVASAALVFAGCAKKPVRPDPSSTVIGPAGGGTGSGALNPVDMGTSLNPDGLASRNGGFDANGQDRSALAAQTVYFDFDKHDIKASERPKLQAAKDYLNKNPGNRLLLEGHCDWRGTAEYNLSLGDRRANAAKKYLLSIGVPADRVETLSKGSLEAAKNADDATMAKDRRVDLVVVQANGTALPAGTGMSTAPAAGFSDTPAAAARPGAL
jgi:peptidoglycan-associated lipoprotein